MAPMAVVERLRAASTTVLPPADDSGPLAGAPAEETALIERWLYESGTRLVDVSDQLSLPIGAAERWRDFARIARSAREATSR
ncbi:hypothetical protein UG54_19915 [Gordonia sihwensis]|nr:hypothetical protein UG54_19915 [Gordonia sihwensis]